MRSILLISIFLIIVARIDLIAQQKRDTVEVNRLINLSDKYRYSNTDSSLLVLQQALSLSKVIGDEKGKRTSFYKIGQIYQHDLGQLDSALNYYEFSLEANRVLDDSTWIAASLMEIGVVHSMTGRHQKALEHYLESLKIKKILGDSVGVSESLNNIGTVYFRQNNFDKALQYYKETLDMERRHSEPNEQASTLGNIGLVFMSLENYTEALIYLKKSYNILDSLIFSNHSN